MGGACNTYGGRRAVYRVLVGRSELYRPIEDLNVDGRIILIWNF